jgi:predicted transcriptional regulator
MEMKRRFNEKMNFKLPQELVESLEAIARRRMMSRSAYCPQALLEKLERDGICPTPMKATSEIAA